MKTRNPKPNESSDPDRLYKEIVHTASTLGILIGEISSRLEIMEAKEQHIKQLEKETLCT